MAFRIGEVECVRHAKNTPTKKDTGLDDNIKQQRSNIYVPPSCDLYARLEPIFGYTDDSPDFDFGLVCELRFWTTDSQRICTPDDAILVTVILETVCKGNPIFFRQSLLPIDTVRRISWHRIDKKIGNREVGPGCFGQPASCQRLWRFHRTQWI